MCNSNKICREMPIEKRGAGILHKLGLATILLAALVSAASSQDTEAFLRSFADEIIASSKFEFVDQSNGEHYSSTRELLPNKDLKVEAMYLHWHYTSALVHDGLLSLGTVLGEQSYSDFGENYFKFVFDNKPYLERIKSEGYNIEGLDRFGRFRGLWDNGAQAAALVQVYERDQQAEYLAYLGKVADFFFKYDDDPKNMSRKFNIDQIYTKGVFMARMGRLTGEQRYFDYCVKEVLASDRSFFDPLTGLYDQIYFPEQKSTNKIKWLRGMGWSAMALVNILDCLPEDHPGYHQVLNVFHKHIKGIAAYQTRTGLWKHLVNHPDSYDETSGSVYIVYAVARGINLGLLDPVYRDVAMAGWNGIMSKQQADGSITGSTTGVSSSTSPAYYLNYPRIANSDHLMGPLFLAGAEMIKLYGKFEKPVPKDWDLQ